MTKMWVHYEIPHAQMNCQALASRKVTEAFNSHDKHQIKSPNHWCRSKDIHLSWFKLIRPLKVIRIMALNVCKSGASGLFTAWMRTKVSIGALVWCFLRPNVQIKNPSKTRIPLSFKNQTLSSLGQHWN